MQDEIRAHIFVSGKVQGVFFRSSTQEKARELGLRGFVQNLLDGRVEIVTEGRKDKVEELIDWIHSGPSTADVEEVKVDRKQPEGDFRAFNVRY